MDQSSCVTVFCLSSANKYKIYVPSKHTRSSVRDLKLYIQQNEKLPIDTQILFICRDGKRFELLDDDSKEKSKLAETATGATLHLYVKKTSQSKRLEKTRQSDFDEWLTKFKKLDISPNYNAEHAQRAPNAAPNAAPAARHPSAPSVASRPSSSAEASFAHASAEPPPSNTVRPPAPAAPPAVRAAANHAMRPAGDHSMVSDHCQVCYRNDKNVPPTYYCYNCDEQSCVLCDLCAVEKHESIDFHELESIGQPGSLQSSQLVRDVPQGPAPPRNPYQTARDDAFQKDLKWVCSACTVHNLPHEPHCEICDAERPADFQIPDWYQPKDKELAIIASQAALADAQRNRWACPQCTSLNLPHRPSCEACIWDRPADYKIPDGYEPTAEELVFIGNEAASRIAMEQALEEEKRLERLAREENRQALLRMDDTILVTTTEAFECTICYTECEPGEGVLLRNCLHSFCKDCLKGHIESSENPEVICPHAADDHQCNEIIPEREVKEIAPDFYPKLLEKSLQVAESQAANSFHCKSLNCPGWCTYDEDVNFFECQVCQTKNCLTCKAIHENQDCQEYQVELKRKAEIDVEARKTQEELERLVKEGGAMHCPHCDIVIMKKDGCDWIKCSVCKTEICWVTKQARWGPKGPGDTSGGCKCGIGGKNCHPNCGNCH